MRAIFQLEAKQGNARSGFVTTSCGTVETPCFMPVGTRGAVRHLDSSDLESLGAKVLLANMYHLMLRPGVDVIAKLGGVHAFMGWSKQVLTDSGGYQIFSLKADVDDDGATFRSVYDGSKIHVTPENAVDIQAQIGADITMVLDVCLAGNMPRLAHQDAMLRTSVWAQRAREAFLRHESSEKQSQFGIVQGGPYTDIRMESAERTVDIGFDGYAVGGLSVGEDKNLMFDALEATLNSLPKDMPRYFMGLGDPVGIIESVARGVDMFDCVLPTRLARHGAVLSDAGRYNLEKACNIYSDQPLDPNFPESPANRWSRGYLRHLLITKEPTAARILTLHNLAWLLRFMKQIREALQDGTFQQMRTNVHQIWGSS